MTRWKDNRIQSPPKLLDAGIDGPYNEPDPYAEIERLRQALFKIQCEQLDRATDIARSAKSHREKCMATRDRIIAILNQQFQHKEG